MERFTSPWALDYADEVKFNNTVKRVGEVLGSDMKLQALYHMLVMMTPAQKQVFAFSYLHCTITDFFLESISICALRSNHKQAVGFVEAARINDLSS